MEKQMSVLSGLKLVSAKRPAALAPIQICRNKLIVNLTEQIALATALKDGGTFAPKRLRRVKDEQSGEIRSVEVTKRVRQWWFTAESGKVCVQLRYGSKVIDIAKGKNSVEVSNGAELISVLSALKTAVETGELDAQITAAAEAIRARFGK
jgi:hypothetical protein